MKNPPKKEHESKKVDGKSALRDLSSDPVFNDTDIANGRRFVADHGDRVRYVADWKLWMAFDGARWVPDKSLTLVQRLAKETTDCMAREAARLVGVWAKSLAETEDEEEKKSTGKALNAAGRSLGHAKRSQDIRAINRMLESARSEPRVNVQIGWKLFDTQPHLLNTQNGTVDLRTGKLHPHRNFDFITRISPLAYYPNAKCCDYLRFLERVFHGMPAVAKYVRELSGYVATGETCDHSFHIFHGLGSNGKSVLLNFWSFVLGKDQYHHTAAPELLINDGKYRHPTERIGLRGARLVVAQETQEDGLLNEAMVKALTSEDMISARGMGQDFFSFPPTHKMVLSSNHKPRLRGTDHGLRRRIRLVPFVTRFWRDSDRAFTPGEVLDPRFKADPGLEKKLKRTDAHGILADMVVHAKAFYASGCVLKPPGEVMAATIDYFNAEDIIGQFFEGCVTADPAGSVSALNFYKSFRTWGTGEGIEEHDLPSGTKFGAKAKKRFSSDRTAAGIVYRVRLRRF